MFQRQKRRERERKFWRIRLLRRQSELINNEEQEQVEIKEIECPGADNGGKDSNWISPWTVFYGPRKHLTDLIPYLLASID